MAGRTTLNPFEKHPVTIAGVDDIVGACERAAAGPQIGHEAVGTTALAQTLDHAGISSTEAFVSVHRSGEGLRVELNVPMETSKEVRDIASVRVVGALREYDPHVPGINASCQDLS